MERRSYIQFISICGTTFHILARYFSPVNQIKGELIALIRRKQEKTFLDLPGMSAEVDLQCLG
jgi:hypothetical protein